MAGIDEMLAPPERKNRIRRLLVLIVLISVGAHILAGLGAGIWVIARYFSQPKAQFVVQKTVRMDPRDREHVLQMEEVTSLRPKPVFDNRIQSLRPSKLALPELPRVPLETITPMDAEAVISDQVDGLGIDGDGSGNGGGFFGGKGAAGSGLLAGRLYDLKQTESGEKTIMGEPVPDGTVSEKAKKAYLNVVNRLSRTASTEAILGEFFKAPQTLYLANLAIPVIGADQAPAAFEVAGKVEPRYWIAVYRGRFKAPESGQYRFLGSADDILLVKINGRLVFDGSIIPATRLFEKEGSSFTVEKDQAYEMEVIIGECPGGRFNAWLQIQKQGEGSRPYWFRMSSKDVQLDTADRGDGWQKLPDVQANGPVWMPASKKQSIDHGL